MVDLITTRHVAHRWVTGGGPCIGRCDNIVHNEGLRTALAAPTQNAESQHAI